MVASFLASKQRTERTRWTPASAGRAGAETKTRAADPLVIGRRVYRADGATRRPSVARQPGLLEAVRALLDPVLHDERRRLQNLSTNPVDHGGIEGTHEEERIEWNSRESKL